MAGCNTNFYCQSDFTVDGMTCGSCVQAIKNAVSSLGSHIFTVSVSLQSASATVTHTDGISTGLICSTISDAGFDCSLSTSAQLAMKQSRFEVIGMTCDSCVHSICLGLREMGGVLRVDVSLSQRLATVEHDVKVTSDKIAGKIGELGFDAYLLCTKGTEWNGIGTT